MGDVTSVLIRPAAPGDAEVARLAQLDSATLVWGPALVAEESGEARAALFLDDGSVVADPFRHTSHLVQLLRTHAAANGHANGSKPLLARLTHDLLAAG